MKSPQLKSAEFKRPSLAYRPGTPMTQTMTKTVAHKMVKVAPGRYITTSNDPVPDFTFARWLRCPDGQYELIPEGTHFVRLTDTVIRMLGFNERADTIFRLGRAGFVELAKVAPQTVLLNLDSWWNHVRRCVEDPEFWNKTGNLDEYRRAL